MNPDGQQIISRHARVDFGVGARARAVWIGRMHGLPASALDD
jgi:hypothetical protein